MSVCGGGGEERNEFWCFYFVWFVFRGYRNEEKDEIVVGFWREKVEREREKRGEV